MLLDPVMHTMAGLDELLQFTIVIASTVLTFMLALVR